MPVDCYLCLCFTSNFDVFKLKTPEEIAKARIVVGEDDTLCKSYGRTSKSEKEGKKPKFLSVKESAIEPWQLPLFAWS